MSSAAAKVIAANPSLGELGPELTGGLSKSSVHELMCGTELSVLMVQEDPIEHYFYTKIRPYHFPNSSWLPHVFANGNWKMLNWIVLEYIPNSWPRERFNFDESALSVLRDLHRTPVGTGKLRILADHTWTRDQLAVAKKYLPPRCCKQLDLVIESYELRGRDQKVLCSGDPNAPNWLIRDEGDIVLIDWQQMTFDHPALDIAGWLATLLTFDEFVEVASIYYQEPIGPRVISFARDVFVFFSRRIATNFWRAEISSRPEAWQKGINRMKKEFPTWLDQGIRKSKLAIDA